MQPEVCRFRCAGAAPGPRCPAVRRRAEERLRQEHLAVVDHDRVRDDHRLGRRELHPLVDAPAAARAGMRDADIASACRPSPAASARAPSSGPAAAPRLPPWHRPAAAPPRRSCGLPRRSPRPVPGGRSPRRPSPPSRPAACRPSAPARRAGPRPSAVNTPAGRFAVCRRVTATRTCAAPRTAPPAARRTSCPTAWAPPRAMLVIHHLPDLPHRPGPGPGRGTGLARRSPRPRRPPPGDRRSRWALARRACRASTSPHSPCSRVAPPHPLNRPPARLPPGRGQLAGLGPLTLGQRPGRRVILRLAARAGQRTGRQPGLDLDQVPLPPRGQPQRPPAGQRLQQPHRRPPALPELAPTHGEVRRPRQIGPLPRPWPHRSPRPAAPSCPTAPPPACSAPAKHHHAVAAPAARRAAQPRPAALTMVLSAEHQRQVSRQLPPPHQVEQHRQRRQRVPQPPPPPSISARPAAKAARSRAAAPASRQRGCR